MTHQQRLERRNKALRMIVEGKSIKEIAKKVKLGPNYLYSLARSGGVGRGLPRRPYDLTKIKSVLSQRSQDIIEKWQEGLTTKQIAKTLKLSFNQVRGFLTTRRIKPNPPSGPRWAKVDWTKSNHEICKDLNFAVSFERVRQVRLRLEQKKLIPKIAVKRHLSKEEKLFRRYAKSILDSLAKSDLALGQSKNINARIRIAHRFERIANLIANLR
jgi:DNA-binding CsgD family transcriptional regulator